MSPPLAAAEHFQRRKPPRVGIMELQSPRRGMLLTKSASGSTGLEAQLKVSEIQSMPDTMGLCFSVLPHVHMEGLTPCATCTPRSETGGEMRHFPPCTTLMPSISRSEPEPTGALPLCRGNSLAQVPKELGLLHHQRGACPGEVVAPAGAQVGSGKPGHLGH